MNYHLPNYDYMLKLLLGDERNMVNSQTSSHLEQKNTAMDVKQEAGKNYHTGTTHPGNWYFSYKWSLKKLGKSINRLSSAMFDWRVSPIKVPLNPTGCPIGWNKIDPLAEALLKFGG
jgi:hypothetical protein